MPMQPYVNYHKHDVYSNLMLPDSIATLDDYADRALELGHQILSSCAHGTQGNIWACASVAEKKGLRWRYVAEAYFVPDRHQKDNTNAHLIVAARTQKGIGDLNMALSEANLTGYYYRPRLDMDLLLSLNPKDIFVTTACLGGVAKFGAELAEKIVIQLQAHFRNSFMLEVQNHPSPKQCEVNEFILKLSRKHGVPLIAGMDSHFNYPEEAALRDYRLEANHIKYEDEGGFFMDYPSEEEAIQRFKRQGVLSNAHILEAMENTLIFLDFEDVKLDSSRKIPTIYPNLSQEERNNLLRRTVYAEWERYATNLSEDERAVRLEGLAYELDTITSTNVSDYFLLNYEIVRRAKEKGGIITETGRGSAVSYFMNMLLGFSSVDRFSIPVEMFPDRFISADRILSGSLPDIDLNVANEAVFQKAQADVLGEWRSAPMVAFSTLRRLSAWKMFCRAKSVAYETAQRVGDMLKRYELDLKHAEDDTAVDVFSYVPDEYHELVKQSGRFMGLVDSISPHPCAHLLANGDIRRDVGIIRLNAKTGKKKPVYAALIDGASAEAYGFLKNDLLHVDVVSINREVFERVGVSQPDVKRLLELTRNDDKTWRMYADGLTMGLNQVERPKTRDKLMQYKPRNITELSAFVAAVRPGFKSMLPVFLDRKRFDYGIPAFDRLIQTREMTSSFVLFQEQTMKTMQYAGFSAPESYAAIKAIAKKKAEKVLPLRDRFLEGFSARILADDPACPPVQAKEMSVKVWQIIEDTTQYSFNSSHAVCVALDSLYGAYAKAHYPLEYFATLLSNYALKADKERIGLVKEEMRKGFGIRVVPCRFRQDNRVFSYDREANTISDALTSVKHISAVVATALYTRRGRYYKTFTDVLLDLEMDRAFTITSTEILIRMGYFAEFGSIGKLLALFKEFKEGENRFAKTHVEATRQKRLDLLREAEQTCPALEISISEQVQFEVEHFGTLLSTFPEHVGQFAVLEVDERYSPKIRLYNLSSGSVGVMKVRKPVYSDQPVKIGDIIQLVKWERRPAYQFIDGKAIAKKGETELWIQAYKLLTS